MQQVLNSSFSEIDEHKQKLDLMEKLTPDEKNCIRDYYSKRTMALNSIKQKVDSQLETVAVAPSVNPQKEFS